MGPFKLLPLNYGFPFIPSHCVPKGNVTFKKNGKWRPGGSDRLLGHIFALPIVILQPDSASVYTITAWCFSPPVFLFAVIIVFSLFFFFKKHFQILYQWKVLYKYVLLTYITRFNRTAAYLWESCPKHVSACVLLSPHSPTLSQPDQSRGQRTQ